jgi:hypothetical protein
MSDEPKKWLLGRWIWPVIILLLLAYPLSMGPVLRYSDPHDDVWDLYYPVVLICESCRPLESAKDWYNDLWGVGYWHDKSGTRLVRIRFRP